MKDKFVIGVAIAVIATFALAVAVVQGISRMNAGPGNHASLFASPKQEEPRVGVIIRPSADQPPAAPAATSEPAVTPPPAPNQVTVADLKELASTVHLTNPNSHASTREWKLAIDKAQKMMNQACDCEERYWLNQFVETGNQALNHSDDYPKSVEVLVSLPKNDDEATTHHISSL